jgi:hypothetical protein
MIPSSRPLVIVESAADESESVAARGDVTGSAQLFPRVDRGYGKSGAVMHLLLV